MKLTYIKRYNKGGAMGYSNKRIKLNNGSFIPSIGFGTSLIEGKECVDLIKTAIEVGYNHIDTAAVYKNEKEIEVNFKLKMIF